MNRHQSVEIAPTTTSSKRLNLIPTSPSSQPPLSPVGLPEVVSLAYVKSQFAAESHRAALRRRPASTTLCSTHDPCAPLDDFTPIVQTDSMCTKPYHSLYPIRPIVFFEHHPCPRCTPCHTASQTTSQSGACGGSGQTHGTKERRKLGQVAYR